MPVGAGLMQVGHFNIAHTEIVPNFFSLAAQCNDEVIFTIEVINLDGPSIPTGTCIAQDLITGDILMVGTIDGYGFCSLHASLDINNYIISIRYLGETNLFAPSSYDPFDFVVSYVSPEINLSARLIDPNIDIEVDISSIYGTQIFDGYAAIYDYTPDGYIIPITEALPIVTIDDEFFGIFGLGTISLLAADYPGDHMFQAHYFGTDCYLPGDSGIEPVIPL